MYTREDFGTPAHLTATATVRAGLGVLHQVVINTPGEGTITIYDGVSTAGTVIGVITLGGTEEPSNIDFCCKFTVGLHVVISGTMDITVVYH